jgi:hypothetical protein
LTTERPKNSFTWFLTKFLNSISVCLSVYQSTIFCYFIASYTVFMFVCPSISMICVVTFVCLYLCRFDLQYYVYVLSVLLACLLCMSVCFIYTIVYAFVLSVYLIYFIMCVCVLDYIIVHAFFLFVCLIYPWFTILRLNVCLSYLCLIYNITYEWLSVCLICSFVQIDF